MNTLYRFAFLALVCLPVACAASAEQRVPLPSQSVTVTDASLARIYFVRDDSAVLQNRALRVFDGATEIGSLNRDTYLCWERPGGRSVGRAFYEALDPSRGQLEGIADLDCAAGRAHYFTVRIASEDGRPVVAVVAPEAGRRLVSARRPASVH